MLHSLPFSPFSPFCFFFIFSFLFILIICFISFLSVFFCVLFLFSFLYFISPYSSSSNKKVRYFRRLLPQGFNFPMSFFLLLRQQPFFALCALFHFLWLFLSVSLLGQKLLTSFLVLAQRSVHSTYQHEVTGSIPATPLLFNEYLGF